MVNTEGNDTIFELSGIRFTYGKSLILKNINLKVPKGNLIAIAGPNGSGKTTLIKHFNGLHHPDQGEVYLRGQKVENFNRLPEEVGMVFQNPDEQVFFPDVEDDIAFGLRNMGLDENEIKTRVEDTMHTLDILNLRGRNFFNLSFGEKKKIAFAGVLATEPTLMILDEPTIGLDPWSKENFLDLILQMKKKAEAIIVATHDFDVLKIADEIHLLFDGEIVAVFDEFDEFKEQMYDYSPEHQHGEIKD